VKKRVGAFSRLLLFPLGLLLAAGCPLEKSTYVLRRSGQDWLRIGSDPNGEIILRFTLGRREKSLTLAQVVDRIRIERLDRLRHPMDPRSDEAPAFIRIEGLTRIADIPDGEWRLARCAEH
jgi:hypothetical protein